MSRFEPDGLFHRTGVELRLHPGDLSRIEAARQRLLAELVNDPLASRVGSGPAVRRFGAVRAEARAAADASAEASVTLSQLDQQRAAVVAAGEPGWSAVAAEIDVRAAALSSQTTARSAALKGPLAEAADEALREVEDVTRSVFAAAATALRGRAAERLGRIVALIAAEIEAAIAEQEVLDFAHANMAAVGQGLSLAGDVDLRQLADAAAAESAAKAAV